MHRVAWCPKVSPHGHDGRKETLVADYRKP
jgi:hypothetical protein